MTTPSELPTEEQLRKLAKEGCEKMTPQDWARQRIEYAVMSTAPNDKELQDKLRRRLEEQNGLTAEAA